VQQLPLPDVDTERQDLAAHIIFEFLPALGRRQSQLRLRVFRPFTLPAWLQLTSTSSSTRGGSTGDKADSEGAAAAAASKAVAGSSPLLLQLPGLFRGAYGGHGIELVQLQLAAVPAADPSVAGDSSSATAAAAAAAFVADSRDEALQQRDGVILQGLTGSAGQTEAGPVSDDSSSTDNDAAEAVAGSAALAADELPDGIEQAEDEVWAAADEDEHSEGSQGHESATDSESSCSMDEQSCAAASEAAVQQEVLAASTAAAGAAAQVNRVEAAAATSAGAEREQPAQQQQLLLVGTKVQGDVNVPAGHVTFAFDLSSRSLQGAGQPLQLPSGVRSRVDLVKPGVRQLIVQVRGPTRVCVY
jgi:hypothetical protein